MSLFSKFRHRLGLVKTLPRDAYYTLSGWRFDDLKGHISNSVAQDHDAALSMLTASMLTMRSTNASSTDAPPKIALITCLPPDETGIANFSFEHLSEFSEKIAVFSPVRDVPRHLHNCAVLNKKSRGKVSVYPVGSLLALDALWNFDRIVVVIGNSSHNVEAFHQIEHLAALGRAQSLVCYLHDPCCLNVVQLGKSLSDHQMSAYMSDIYSDRQIAEHAGPSWSLHASFVKQEAYGIRALYDAGIRQFIVNSKFAADMLRRDLKSEQRTDCSIDVLFHPVLAHYSSEEREATTPTEHTVGTFGAAADAKATDVVIDAIAKLNANGSPTKLLVVGYGANKYIRARYGHAIPSWLAADEPETERDLQLAMMKCSIAVQLRRESLGESSGVVPTLIGLGVPTVVSPIGAFTEYDSAVHYFSGYNAEELSQVISTGLSVERQAMANYKKNHLVSEFNRKLLGILKPRSGRKKIAVYGSCHAGALEKYILKTSVNSGLDLVQLPPQHEISDGELSDFKRRQAPRLDWLVYQPISAVARGEQFSSADLLSHIGAATRTLRFSYPHFELYNPYSLSLAEPLPPCPHPYVDYAVGALVMNGRRGDELLGLYEAGPDFAPFKSAVLESCISSLQQRESRTLPRDQAIDVTISGFVQDNFATKRLFWTMNHPTNALLLPLFDNILSKIEDSPHEDSVFDELLYHEVVPIPQYVAQAYELYFEHTGLCRFANQTVTLEKYLSDFEKYFSAVDPDLIRKAIINLSMNRPWFSALLPFGL